jgi:signal transduction histidine kinase
MTPEKIQERLASIRGGPRHITNLINNLLNVAIIEDENIGFSPEQCNPGHVALMCIQSQLDVAPGFEIVSDFEELSNTIFYDPMHLTQILNILLSNAVKYSPESKEIKVRGWNDKNSTFISVSDYGVGIPTGDMANMFKRYFRAGNVTNIPGAGISLHVAMKLLDAQGGEIALESIDGEGTTVTVRLPTETLGVDALL